MQGGTIGRVTSATPDAASDAVAPDPVSPAEGQGEPPRADQQVEQRDLVVEQGDLVIEQGDLVVEQADLAVEQGDLVVEQADLAVGQGDLVIEQADLVVEQGDLVIGQGDLVVEQGEVAERWPADADQWASAPEFPDALFDAVELAREAAVELADADAVGEHQEALAEDGGAVTHYFAANQPGYRGWRWAVTVACAGADSPVTVSEMALLPGPDALVAPAWVPWQERVRPGDLGVGDLLPTDPDDPRLVPGYLAAEDLSVRDVAFEVGLGRPRVLSPLGRDEAGERWFAGQHGPRSEMARAAPGTCRTCGFYLMLAGSMSAAFGVCANEYAPADGAVVHAEYGCGAHSDVEPDQGTVTPVAEVVYDDGVDLETR
jgi:hypothetical protein